MEGSLAELARRGFKGSSRRRKVAAIGSSCTFLVQWDYLAANRADRLIPPHRGYEQPRALTEAEYSRLLKADQHEMRDATIIEVLVQTGMHLLELAGLALADVTRKSAQSPCCACGGARHAAGVACVFGRDYCSANAILMRTDRAGLTH